MGAYWRTTYGNRCVSFTGFDARCLASVKGLASFHRLIAACSLKIASGVITMLLRSQDGTFSGCMNGLAISVALWLVVLAAFEFFG